MKIICSVQELRTAFSALASICPSRSPNPVLSHLKLTCREGAFSLEATDLEVWARRSWPGKGGDGFEILLPSASVGGILKETDEETMELELRESRLELRTKDTHLRLPKANPVDFPAWPESQADGSFEIPAKQWAAALRRVAFAAAQERTRYALNGVLVSLSGKGIEWVATDGRRLSLVEGEAKSASGSAKAILGLKMVSFLERIFADADAPLRVSMDKRFCRVASAGTEVLGRLVEGTYPDYRAVIPKDLPERFSIDAQELERAIRKAMLVTSATSGSIGWKLGDRSLEISGQSTEEGEAKVTLAADYEGKGLQIRFNPRFLLEAIRAAGDPRIEVALKNPSSAGLLRLSKDSLCVVLPVHLVS